MESLESLESFQASLTFQALLTLYSRKDSLWEEHPELTTPQTHTQNTPSKQYYLPFEYEHASPLVSLQILVEDFESQPPHASELAIPIASPSLPYTLSIIQSTLFYQTLQSREYHSFHEYLLPYYHDQEVHEVLYLSNHSYSTNAFMSILCVVFA